MFPFCSLELPSFNQQTHPDLQPSSEPPISLLRGNQALPRRHCSTFRPLKWCSFLSPPVYLRGSITNSRSLLILVLVKQNQKTQHKTYPDPLRLMASAAAPAVCLHHHVCCIHSQLWPRHTVFLSTSSPTISVRIQHPKSWPYHILGDLPLLHFSRPLP